MRRSRTAGSAWLWRTDTLVVLAGQSRERDSNPRPFAYKAKALPAELSRRSADSTALDLDSMVSKTYPMEDFHTVVEDMHHGTLARGVLTF